MSTKPNFAAFNQGAVSAIACFNKATVPLGVDLDKLIAAMQHYVDQYVMPVWGTPAKLIKSTDFVAVAWAIVFLDDADQPGALAYHDLTPDGFPESFSGRQAGVRIGVEPGQFMPPGQMNLLNAVGVDLFKLFHRR